MFGRIFGRGKDEPEAAVCAMCGRTLLAGEWTRKVAGANGDERLVCSLCGPDLPLDDRDLDEAHRRSAVGGPADEEVPVRQESADDPAPSVGASASPASSVASIVTAPPTPDDSALSRLERRLADVEARCDELADEVARWRQAAPAGDLETAVPEAEAPIDSSEPGERTWGETPAEFAALLQASEAVISEPPVEAAESAAEAESPDEVIVETADAEGFEGEATVTAEPAGETPVAEESVGPETSAGGASELEPPDDTLAASVTADDAGQEDAVVAVVEDAVDQASKFAEGPDEITAAGAALTAEERADVDSVAPDAEAEVVALARLQRGVDLFNVSRVPRRIAETNEQLGTPEVRAEALDEGIVSIAFMWSMGWYRFHVDPESGGVDMAERGYDEIKGVASNAGVRADGTIHLAPAQISTAAAHRVQQEDSQGAHGDRGPSEPEPPSVAAQKAPEILSKSLLGQRSDDEPADWEKTRARDFDWER